MEHTSRNFLLKLERLLNPTSMDIWEILRSFCCNNFFACPNRISVKKSM